MRIAVSALILMVVGAFDARAQTVFTVSLDGAQADAGNGTGSGFTGSGTVTLNGAEDQITVAITHDIPSVEVTAGHVHEGAVGVSGPIVFPFAGNGISPVNEVFAISPAQVAVLKANGYYVNIHTNTFPNGEIRGQVLNPAVAAPISTPWVIALLAALLALVSGVVLRRRLTG